MNTIKHLCVPQTLSPEALADWIQTQKVDQENHIEQIPLTMDEIVELEHTSSLASRAIDKLLATKKYFDDLIKKGTSYDNATETYRPATVTIQPTKGMDALKANREFADKQITLGHKEEITALYLIPYPEQSKMIMVNIVGVEWPDYSRDMTGDEVNQFKPLLKAIAKETIAETATIVDSKADKKKKKEEKIAADEALFPEGEKIMVIDPPAKDVDDTLDFLNT